MKANDTQTEARATPSLIATLRVLVVLVMTAVAGAFPIAWILSLDVADAAPEFAWLRWPLLLICLGLVICAEAMAVALLKLLSRVRDEVIFDARALGWVNVIVWAGAAVVVLLALALVPVVAVTSGPPGLTLVLVAGICAGAGFTLLMVVMRQLLVQATAMRSELAEVI